MVVAMAPAGARIITEPLLVHTTSFPLLDVSLFIYVVILQALIFLLLL